MSILTFAGWLARTGRPAEALMHAIAVLVIACPCALGIATPLALTTAVAAAARRGILVSDTRVLETIRAVDVVVLDKTGTATTGQFQLARSRRRHQPHGRIGRSGSLLRAPHRQSPGGTGPAASWPATSRIHTGQGISGVVGETRYFLGNRQLVEAYVGQAVRLPTRSP